jgi:glycosyltransferase 2 family protein
MTSRRIRIAMLVVGVPAIALAAWYTYGDIQELEAPPLWALVPAGLANLASLWCSSRSWDVLFGDAVPRRLLTDAFFTSQLMKYTPVGGVAQAVGQAALARTDDVGTARAGTAMLVSKLTMVIAGGVFGPVLALSNSSLPGWVRLALMATPVVFVFGRRGLLAWSLDVMRKVLPRTPDHTVLPAQREVWISVAWAVPGLGFAGLSFALLAIPAGLGVGWVQATAGFALAWVIGFLVIPIPSGLGVREAALGLLVGGDPSAKLVAAVLFRAVAIATEGLAFGVVRVRDRRDDAVVVPPAETDEP